MQPHTGTDGAIDGHEPFRLPEMEAGDAAGQRLGRDSSACDRKIEREPEAVKRALLSPGQV